MKRPYSRSTLSRGNELRPTAGLDAIVLRENEQCEIDFPDDAEQRVQVYSPGAKPSWSYHGSTLKSCFARGSRCGGQSRCRMLRTSFR